MLPADVDIENLPRRRTDNARIVDRNKYTIKLYTADGGTKLLRRPDGKVERQYRLNVGSLPVAYTSDKPAGADDSDILYIMDRAVTSFQGGGKLAVSWTVLGRVHVQATVLASSGVFQCRMSVASARSSASQQRALFHVACFGVVFIGALRRCSRVAMLTLVLLAAVAVLSCRRQIPPASLRPCG